MTTTAAAAFSDTFFLSGTDSAEDDGGDDDEDDDDDSLDYDPQYAADDDSTAGDTDDGARNWFVRISPEFVFRSHFHVVACSGDLYFRL